MRKEIEFQTPASAKVIEVIYTKALRGAGTEENPIRDVHQYWSKEGILLAEKDNYKK